MVMSDANVSLCFRDDRSGRLPMPETSDAESEADSEVFQQQLEELGGRLNVENDRTGFLAMINRTHTFNSSAVSLGSILSFASSTGGPTPQRTASFKVRVHRVVEFSPYARIFGECSTIHSPLAVMGIFFSGGGEREREREVEITSRTLTPLFRPGLVHSGSAS